MIVAKLELHKLPKKCIFCQYQNFEEDSIIKDRWDMICTITGYSINDNKKRPIWCPLIEIK